MDSIRFDINAEYDAEVKKVSEKFGYSKELQDVLKKILPSMLTGASYEDRGLFYRMLAKTPIFLLPEVNKEAVDALEKQYMGNINPHIQEEKNEDGEYDRMKEFASGALVSDVILSEDLEIQGTKQFIYVQRVANIQEASGNLKRRCELFGTGIQVSDLIHELGHAWAAEKDRYKMDNGQLVERTGTVEYRDSFEKIGDKKYIRRHDSSKYIMFEESLNTSMQIRALQRYLGKSREEIKDIFDQGIITTSVYQWSMCGVAEYFLENLMANDLQQWRMHGDQQALARLNSAMSKCRRYCNRNTVDEDEAQKSDVFEEEADNELMQEFLRRCRGDFFPDKTNMTPIDIMENALLQCYDLSVNSKCFNLFDPNNLRKFNALQRNALFTLYGMINGTNLVLKEENEATKSS